MQRAVHWRSIVGPGSVASLRRKGRSTIAGIPEFVDRILVLDDAFTDGRAVRHPQTYAHGRRQRLATPASSLTLVSMSRSEKLLSIVDPSMRVIELGPSHSPLAPKAEGWNVSVVDHGARDELVEKYRIHPVDVSRIEEVDVIWTSGPLDAAFPPDALGTYDAIIASHVLEHIPDLIGAFRSFERLLVRNRSGDGRATRQALLLRLLQVSFEHRRSPRGRRTSRRPALAEELSIRGGCVRSHK